MKCKTCNGRGAVTGPTVSGHDTTEREYLEGLAEHACPEPHVAVREWVCVLDLQLEQRCTAVRPVPSPSRRFHINNGCGERVVYHDPATVLAWCETHGSPWTLGAMWGWDESDSPMCDVVAYTTEWDGKPCRVKVRELGAVLGWMAT